MHILITKNPSVPLVLQLYRIFALASIDIIHHCVLLQIYEIFNYLSIGSVNTAKRDIHNHCLAI